MSIRRFLAFAILLSTITATGAAPSASPKEALTLRRITEYWKDGDFTSVKREIGAFLENNPNSSLHDHLSAMLGDLYFQERSFDRALASYKNITDPEVREKTFFNQLQAEFEMSHYVSVIDRAERYLNERTDLSSKQQLKMRYLLAESCFRHGLKVSDLDEKVQFLKKAKPHYKALSQTKLGDRALFPLAEIHRLLREDERAARLYLMLAEKYPKHRERFLFQTAILQIKESPQEAVATFQKVYEMGGKRSRLSAFNRLLLLYQLEKYENFLSYYNEVIELMPQQKVALLKLYEGRCHYYLGDYTQAVFPLETYVASTEGRSKQRKTALLLLANCARHLNDAQLLERTIHSYALTFPKDRDLPRVLMVHAQMCRDNGQYTQALASLKKISEDFPSYDDAEGVAYDYSLLLSHLDRWAEARLSFTAFLEEYPHSEKKENAWRHLLNCCIEELRSPAAGDAVGAKQTFVKTLSDALAQDGVLSPKERLKYSLVRVKCLCELERYDEALTHLSTPLDEGEDPSYLAESHLLKAICHAQVDNDLGLFVEHAERALEYNPKLIDHETLHLELYNAYLTKADEMSDEGNERAYLKLAADHLYDSNAWKTASLKKENILWLADHYFHEARGGDAMSFDRAKTLYSQLLEETAITNETLFLEKETLKYAHLLEIHGHLREKVSVLEALIVQQEQKKNVDWKLQRRTLLELAKAYEATGKKREALASYDRLVDTSGRVQSVVNNSAQLHRAKLKYELLPASERTGDHPEMLTILHGLKDLQIQKRAVSEPSHLEAALSYAEIRIDLSEYESQSKRALFFYNRMRDDFNNISDPATEEYLTDLAADPEKQHLFDAYMGYIEAKVLMAKSSLATGPNALHEQALDILNELSCDDPFLEKRIQDAKVELTRE